MEHKILYDLRQVAGPPKLFFAVAPRENQVSAVVVDALMSELEYRRAEQSALADRKKQEYFAEPLPACVIFSEMIDVQAYLAEKGIPAEQGVILFDHYGPNRFMPLYRGRAEKSFPTGSCVWWGAMMSPAVRQENRVKAVARQLAAGFGWHFMPLVRRGILPFSLRSVSQRGTVIIMEWRRERAHLLPYRPDGHQLH